MSAANTARPTTRPDYGIDAPAVIRNLAIAAVLCLLVVLASQLGYLPAVLVLSPTSQIAIRFPLAPAGLGAGLGMAAGAVWMYLGSRFGKIGERDKLLNRIAWRGDERVLDVGCGRGLLLVGAARRLPTGRATGVDIWQSEDLSGNRADVPLRNAQAEGVADRVAVQTADMRRLPFPDGTFDVVISRAAIHNLYSAADRAAAIREIARVLCPGGQALIVDIRHLREYVQTLTASGCPDARLLDSPLGSVLCALCTMGAMRPNTLLARKSA